MTAISRGDKRSLRLLKMLANKRAFLQQLSKPGIVMLTIEGERNKSCENSLIASWLSSGYVELNRDMGRTTVHAFC